MKKKMDFFLQPFWYVEYERIHGEYYSRLNYFKKYANDELTEEERKRESYQLNVLHKILNNIRSNYNSYFCSNFKDVENLFDVKTKHFKIDDDSYDEEENYSDNVLS
jgi:hypothetical protein